MTRETVRLLIDGMHCTHCENTIENGLLALPGVMRVRANYARGTADVTFNADQVTREALTQKVQQLGYAVKAGDSHPAANALRAAGLLLVIAALFVVMEATGLLNALVPGQLAQAGMGYGMLFVIGLVTSVHCIAMCGGITLSQCVTAEGGSGKKTAALKPSFLYNLGRVISYTVIGFLVGALGGVITFSPAMQGALKLLAGVLMVVMGLNMLHVFPWLRKLNPRIPKGIANRIDAEKWRSNSPLVVGLLNGLMPCGPLQAMQIYALSTGNAFAGALSMLVFSVGTVPLMFGLGALSTLLSRRFTRRMLTVGAVLVAVLGLSMFAQGWTLVQIPMPTATAQSNAATVAPTATADTGAAPGTAGDVQIVNSTLESNRYPNITVQAGAPVRWTINAPQGSINGCNNRMYIPEYQIEHTFTQGDNVIEFTPTETGTFAYSCWMGMIRATITVVEPGTPVPEASQNSSGASGGLFAAESTAPQPAGVSIPTDTLAIAQQTTDEDGNPLQRVSITLTDAGFSPAVVVVQSGVDVEWTIVNRQSAANELWVPEYRAQLALATDENQFYLTPVGDFAFSDQESRYFGYVKVVDDVAQADEPSIRAEVGAYQTQRYSNAYFQEATGGSCCQ